jgi:hypothetical protein
MRHVPRLVVLHARNGRPLYFQVGRDSVSKQGRVRIDGTRFEVQESLAEIKKLIREINQL